MYEFPQRILSRLLLLSFLLGTLPHQTPWAYSHPNDLLIDANNAQDTFLRGDARQALSYYERALGIYQQVYA